MILRIMLLTFATYFPAYSQGFVVISNTPLQFHQWYLKDGGQILMQGNFSNGAAYLDTSLLAAGSYDFVPGFNRNGQSPVFFTSSKVTVDPSYVIYYNYQNTNVVPSPVILPNGYSPSSDPVASVHAQNIFLTVAVFFDAALTLALFFITMLAIKKWIKRAT